MVIQIPFAGFYSSIFEQEMEQQSAYFVENWPESEEGKIEPIVTSEEIADILWRCENWPTVYPTIAKDYVHAFTAWFESETDITLGLKFSDMSSPREYNFETDRVFARIPEKAIKALWQASADDSHDTLKKTIKARHTSCDGFISHYSCNPYEWLAKDVMEYDHNELCTLLVAVMSAKECSEDYDFQCSEDMHDKYYQYFDSAIDWPKFDEMVGELRQEKEANEKRAKPYRCTETMSLPF